MNIRIGARPSPLAIRQAEEIRSRLPGVIFETVAIKTPGDRDKTTPLSGREKSDFFTYDIEKELLAGRIDAAVHSAKDVEGHIPDGLIVAAVTKSVSPFECLVSRGNLRLDELPAGALVGTSSLKRREAVLRFRDDLNVKDIRGDIDERLRQLDEGAYDAVIIAHAALVRLGYEARIAEIIPPHIIEPHPLQGMLAVQVRRDREDMVNIFRSIDGT